MKHKFILIIFFVAAVWQSVYGQFSLNLVWEKDIYPLRIIKGVFSADGNFIYLAIGNTIQKMDPNTGEILSVFDKADSLPYAAISEIYITPSGNYIFTLNERGLVKIWDTRIEKAIFQLSVSGLNDPRGSIRACNISPDEKYLILGVAVHVGGLNYDSFLVLYDINLKKEVKRIKMGIYNGWITKIAVSHDGKYFATGSVWQESIFAKLWHERLILWDTESMTPVDTLEDIIKGTTAEGYKYLKFSYDNKYLGCLRSYPSEALIFDLTTDVKTGFKLKKSDGMHSLVIEFLPDSSSYWLSYPPFTEFYELGSNKFLGRAERWMGVLAISTKTKQILAINGDSLYLYSLPFTDVIEINKSIKGIKLVALNGQILLMNEITFYEKLSVLITDLLGKNIYEEEFINVMPNSKITLKTELQSGVYICKIITGNKEYSQKIQIVR